MEGKEKLNTNPDLKIELGNKIKEFRKQKKLSQVALGDLIGSDQADISKLEKGLLNPSLEYLEKIAVALDKKIKHFFM